MNKKSYLILKNLKSQLINLFLEIPLDIAKGLKPIKCTEKDEVTFDCLFNREVKPEDVEWFKDGEKITPDDSRVKFIHDGKKQSLLITSAELDDAANFEIRVKGIKSIGNLKVKGKFDFRLIKLKLLRRTCLRTHIKL